MLVANPPLLDPVEKGVQGQIDKQLASAESPQALAAALVLRVPDPSDDDPLSHRCPSRRARTTTTLPSSGEADSTAFNTPSRAQGVFTNWRLFPGGIRSNADSATQTELQRFLANTGWRTEGEKVALEQLICNVHPSDQDQRICRSHR